MQKPESTSAMNIYQRLAYVAGLKEVGYVRKEVESGSGGKGVARDLVVATVRKHLLDSGVFVSTTQISGQTIQTGSKSAKGNELIRYEGWYETSFINVDNPADRHIVKHEAHGNDYGDKSPGKASTYAEKLNIIKAMMLETGIADEGRFAHEWEDDTTDQEPEKKVVIGTINVSQEAYEQLSPEQKVFCESEAQKLKSAASEMALADLGEFYDLQLYDDEEKLAINYCLRDVPSIRRKIKDGQKIARSIKAAAAMASQP